MNQEKIGKFIAQMRKEKNLTQEELGNKLGITKNAISKWERGLSLMDLALLKPLSEILEVSINEILQGEKIENNKYLDKYEDNIVKTINYSNQKITKYQRIIALILIIMGLIVIISALMIFPSESSWSSIYSIFGLLLFILGIYVLLKFKWYQKLIITFLIFLSSMGLLLFTDYLNVYFNHESPMYRIRTVYAGDVLYTDTLFYDTYRCYFDTDNEYFVIEKNSQKEITDLLNYCK